MNTRRLLIVDEYTLVRAGLGNLLRSFEGIEVVAEAEDGHQAVQLVGEHHPDVVLMDIAMPRLNGFEATARIAAESSHTRVIILSMYLNEEYVLQALEAGAAGYVLKSADPEELRQAIEIVASGDTYLSPKVAAQVVNYVRRVRDARAENPLRKLTVRQREVLQLVVEGHTTREIAQLLGISIKTVESHRGELMRRLDAHGVADLVRVAIQAGMVIQQP